MSPVSRLLLIILYCLFVVLFEYTQLVRIIIIACTPVTLVTPFYLKQTNNLFFLSFLTSYNFYRTARWFTYKPVSSLELRIRSPVFVSVIVNEPLAGLNWPCAVSTKPAVIIIIKIIVGIVMNVVFCPFIQTELYGLLMQVSNILKLISCLLYPIYQRQ